MKKGIEITDELIAKYFAGGASPEEAMALDDWLQHPANRLQFETLKKVWHASFPSKSPRLVDVQKAWAVVSNQKGKNRGRLVAPFYTNTIFKVAASLLIIVTVGAIFYLNNRTTHPDIMIVTQDTLRLLRLADRSTVTLHRNSVMEYPNEFSTNQREVKFLKGEAFFSIAPDASKPFVVHTRIATIKVLGTAFNIVLKPGTLEVSVDHGKVLVYTEADSIYLTADEAASLNVGETSFTAHVPNSNAWAYATHKLEFNDAPLSEVFSYVEKAQNCDIRVDNVQIEKCRLTATFESVSTDYMLNLIAEALNLSVKTNDDSTFTVGGEGCH